MASDVRLFLRVLRAELEDLIEDTRVFERRLLDRHRNAEITSYVLMENEGVLSRELDGFRGFLEDIDGVDPDSFGDLESLRAFLVSRAQALVDDHEDPQAVVVFVERKLDKIMTYLRAGERDS